MAAKRASAKRSKAAKITAKHGTAGRRADDPVLAETALWYAGKSFSFDWTSWNFPHWIPLLCRYRSRQPRVFEIGSWEGRSALFFLNYLPRARLTCIDSFEGGIEAAPIRQAFFARSKNASTKTLRNSLAGSRRSRRTPPSRWLGWGSSGDGSMSLISTEVIPPQTSIAMPC